MHGGYTMCGATRKESYAVRRILPHDGAGACNARLVLTGDGHPHIVVLTTGKEDETGPYVLRVTEGALPIVQESQCEG